MLDSKVFTILGFSFLLFLSGIYIHLARLRHGEWDAEAPTLFAFATLVPIAVISCDAWLTEDFEPFYGVPYGSRCLYLSVPFVLIHLGIFSSTFMYRAYFHPLKKFPGPFWARVSMWWRVIAAWNAGEKHAVVLDKLHRQYGDVVRIAPNQLSINIVSALPLIHGTGSSCKLTRSASYLNPVNGGSVNADRDPISHHYRRIKWDRALSPKSSDYASRVSGLVSLLLNRLKASNGHPVVANTYLQQFTLDVTGSIGFGQTLGFEQLSTGTVHRVVQDINAMMRIGVNMVFLPWLHCLLAAIPTSILVAAFVYRPDEDVRDFARETFELERKRSSESKTQEPQYIMAHLLAPNTERQKVPEMELTERQMISDAFILILGGSDTTTSALIHTVWRLAQYPTVQQTLFNAIRAADPDPEELLSAETVSKIPYLEALINETIRLHPPGASGMPRLVPEDGLQLEDGLFIPPHTNVSTPTYTLQRDARNFSDPELFLPERWMSRSATELQGPTPPGQIQLNRRAFLPFGAGKYGCPGKAIAYMEMKLVIANLIRRFEIRYPQHADFVEINRRMETEWKDIITARAAELPVCFVERSTS